MSKCQGCPGGYICEALAGRCMSDSQPSGGASAGETPSPSDDAAWLERKAEGQYYADNRLRMLAIAARLRATPGASAGAATADPPNADDVLVSRNYPWCVMDTAAGQQIWFTGGRERISTMYEAARQLNAYAAALRGAPAKRQADKPKRCEHAEVQPGHVPGWGECKECGYTVRVRASDEEGR